MRSTLALTLVSFLLTVIAFAGVKVTQAPGTSHDADGTNNGTYSIEDGGNTLHFHSPGPPASIQTAWFCEVCGKYYRGWHWIEVSEGGTYTYDLVTDDDVTGHLQKT